MQGRALVSAYDPGPITPERRAFVHWLRTGWMYPPEVFADEHKFNPYHDPRNGQFTFAPGGPRSLPGAVRVGRKPDAKPNTPSTSTGLERVARPTFDDGPVRLTPNPLAQTVSVRRSQRRRAGDNSNAFQDPMTQQPLITPLWNAPAGSLMALPDALIAAPAREAAQALTEAYTRKLVAEIQAIDPTYRFDVRKTPKLLAMQNAQIGKLNWDLAAASFRVQGRSTKLQAQTLRFLQARTDAAFESGTQLQRQGRLRSKLSPREALGTYIDREVRRYLRDQFSQIGIMFGPRERVSINSRTYVPQGESAFRIPDSRIDRVAFDVTLTRKTLATPQVRDYFRSEARPQIVIIVRPTQLGPDSSYAITAPKVSK